MCGISGVIMKGGQTASLEKIQYINSSIAHRGPDDEGFLVDGSVALGHRRLSIIDLSSSGHQPMAYQDRYWIIFNGEIYNYIEIREELSNKGYVFSSGSDTEVILAAYDMWGEFCLSKFNGMWAIAIYDKRNQKVFLARDRFGIKPIYYKDNEDTFTFSSEIKQLLFDAENVVVNKNILLESMLTHIDNHTSETYFAGVYSFPAAHYMIYDLKTDEKQIVRYYELAVNPEYRAKSEEELTSMFGRLFEDAIKLRLRSDVKVGTCLSGGLDSSSISAIAAETYKAASGTAFVAINAQSLQSDNDESSFAKEVAENSLLDLNIVTPSYDDFVKAIDEVIYTQEEPFGSPSMFMGWYVFKKARELNCKVMLNGQGGDETLLGYERYFSSTLSLRNPFTFASRLLQQARNSRLSMLHTISYFFYFRNAGLRIRRLKRKSFVKSEHIKEEYFRFIRKSAKVSGNPDALQIFEITTLQLPHLLRYEDRNSMRHSIETRLPFLDYRLVELAISLPAKLKIKRGWTKFILRKCVESILPSNIVWRKNKFGFEAPDRMWLGRYRREMVEEIKSSELLNEYCDIEKITRRFDVLSLKDQWMYFNIARWEKIYNVKLAGNDYHS